jgi:hypothetical protein
VRDLSGATVARHAREKGADVCDISFTAEAEHRGDIDRRQRAVSVAP